ncbi:MAG: carbohydrate porin [Candidatus Eremiobacteraeota bacterium]|nr:carbohydrate porin [Candidatus Eremiobacteraeota bacterium]
MKYLLVIAALFFSLTGMLMGQEEKPPEKAPEAPAQSKIKTNLYLQGSWFDNTEDLFGRTSDLRYFNAKDNAIDLDMAQIWIIKDPLVKNLGFDVKLTAGEYGKLIHARGLGAPDDSFDLTSCWANYTFPVGKGLLFGAGKMETYFGAESYIAWKDPNFSRSFLCCYAQPITHTGIKMAYPFSDALKVNAFVVQGWDNYLDNNSAKSLGFSLEAYPSESVAMYFNAMTGPEQTDNNDSVRTLFDWVGAFKLSKKLSLLCNYDYGSEQNTPDDGTTSTWDGFSLIGVYEFTDKFSIAVRGETFNDNGGSRTGATQNIKEFTITPQFKVGKNMIIRPEYRYDWSNVNGFCNGTKNNQTTYGIGVMMLF